MANANRKGKTGERKAVNFLKDLFGIKARRSQQYSGVRTDDTSADILTDFDDYIRFEVKYGYGVDLHHKECKEWVEQCRDETPNDKQWVILYKKPRTQSWYVIFEVDRVVCMSDDVETVIRNIINEVN